MSLLRFKPPFPKQADPVERTHVVAGRVVPLKIVENARARRLTLRIASAGEGLRVTTPPGIPFPDVQRFIARHQDWLEERYRRLPEDARVRPGIRLPLRGKPHLILHDADRRGTVTATVQDDQPVLLVHGAIEHLPRRLADFLKREAKHDIEILVARHTAAVGRRAKAIRYRDTSSRWGSCTHDGVLSFSWRIMMAPPPVINYLVAHEVAHLREMNHSTRFWKLCTELCPDTERCRDWLKRNGAALQALRFT